MDDRRKAVICLLLILFLSTILRVWDLGVRPRWDFDEGVNLDIAKNLAEGRMQWAALKYSFIPHPPLFFIATAAALKAFGSGLVAMRGMCAFFGVVSTLLLYLIGKDLFDRRTGLVAALMYAVYPSAVYFGRLVYANNLLAALSLLSLLFFVKYLHEKKRRWLLLASCAAGLSAISELLGVCVIAALLFLFWQHDRKNVWVFAAVSSSFVAAFALYMTMVMPKEFIGDLVFSFARFSFPVAVGAVVVLLLALFNPSFGWLRSALVYIYSPVFAEIKSSALLYYVLASGFLLLLSPSDGRFYSGLDFYLLGVVGFAFISDKTARGIVLAFFSAFLIVLVGLNRSDHMLIPLYPFLSVSMAFLVLGAYDSACVFWRRRVANGAHALLLSLLLVSYPIAVIVYYDAGMFFGGGWIATEDAEARAAVLDYVNGNVGEDDFVIVDSHMTRLMECRSAVFIQAASFDGIALEYMRADYGSDRFLFNCSYRNAKFIVLPKNVLQELVATTKGEKRQWAYEVSAELEGWQYVDFGSLRAYINPGAGLVVQPVAPEDQPDPEPQKQQ